MYVSELTDKDLDIIRSYNGTKSIREITEIFNIENKSTKNLRQKLDRNKVEYKKLNKPFSQITNYKGLPKVEQQPGIELEVGKKYSLKDKTNSNEKLFARYKGRIIAEYERYYRGITDTGYCFTIHKYPNCYEIKEI